MLSWPNEHISNFGHRNTNVFIKRKQNRLESDADRSSPTNHGFGNVQQIPTRKPKSHCIELRKH